MISEEKVKEYRAIYKEKFNEDISTKEASEQANNLIGFFKLLLKVDMRNNPHLYKKRKKNKPMA